MVVRQTVGGNRQWDGRFGIPVTGRPDWIRQRRTGESVMDEAVHLVVDKTVSLKTGPQSPVKAGRNFLN